MSSPGMDSGQYLDALPAPSEDPTVVPIGEASPEVIKGLWESIRAMPAWQEMQAFTDAI